MDSSTLTLWTRSFQYKGYLVSVYCLLPYFIEIPDPKSNSVDPDQMPQSAASDLDLHCLPMSILCAARHTWVKET